MPVLFCQLHCAVSELAAHGAPSTFYKAGDDTKTEIYYFSGTGNSLYIARKLNGALAHPGELLPIAWYKGEAVVCSEADTIGIVYPIYMGEPPDIVKKFARKLSADNAAYVFAVATYNSHIINGVSFLSEILRSKLIKLALGETVNMPGNAIESTPEANNERLKASGQRIADIAQKINSGAIEVQEASPEIVQRALTGKISGPVLPTNFKALPSCDGCGICRRVCPMRNIEIVERKPVWGNDCETCLACFHWCPQNAIKWELPGIGSRTQYHHPDIDATDIETQQQTGNEWS